jgi:hypothetical protein
MKKNTDRNPLCTIIAVFAAFAVLLGAFGMTGCSENTTISYEIAERALISNAVSGYSALQNLNGGKGGALTLTITPEQYLADLAGMERFNPTVFEISGSADRNGKFSGIVYKNGEKEVLSADFWLTKELIIAKIPLLGGWYNFAELPSLLSALPKEAINTLIDSVLDEYFLLIAGSSTTKGVESEINGTMVTADKTEIEITDEMAYRLALTALNEIQNNAEIKELVVEAVTAVRPVSVGLIDMMLAGAVSQIEKSLENISKPKLYATMSVYISGSEIVKRVIDITIDNIKVATVELTWSDNAEIKPLPDLNDTSESANFDLNDMMLLQHLDMVFSRFAGMNFIENLDDNGVYDLLGYWLTTQKKWFGQSVLFKHGFECLFCGEICYYECYDWNSAQEGDFS